MDKEHFDRIVRIVQAMNATGSSADDITQTLKQMGLTQEDIDSVIAAVKPSPTLPEVHAKVAEVHEAIVGTGIAQKVEEQKQVAAETREKVEDIYAGLEEHAEALSEIAASSEEHKDRLEDIRSGLEALHQKHDELTAKFSDASEVLREVRELKAMMLEMKPMIAAMRDLNERILDTNRDMLARIKPRT